ncbi:MAG: DUF58 domain-containing protein [Arcobacteraceae bacterium]|jgi:uncharacterized protein (DUF58 family)|nr:DUF58 domain-containing protein [Arcobacteraceae bacterium]
MKSVHYQNNLQLTTKKRLFSHLSGEHSSIFSGNGLDFRELRTYNTSDDIRHLNWKVTARTGTPSVNIFSEDKRLNFVFVFLVSGGIYFGTHRAKKDTMRDVLANLSYAAFNKKDLVSTLFFSNQVESLNYSSKNKMIIEKDIKIANNLKPLGKHIDYKKLESYLLSSVKQKSIIFLIGDFLELPTLRFLSAKHELYVAIVRDKFEEDIKLLGDFNIKDTTSLDSENIFLDEGSLKKYEELMQAHDEALFTMFHKLKIRYKKIYTDDDVVSKLLQLIRD